jgi:hypothetical protein
MDVKLSFQPIVLDVKSCYRKCFKSSFILCRKLRLSSSTCSSFIGHKAAHRSEPRSFYHSVPCMKVQETSQSDATREASNKQLSSNFRVLYRSHKKDVQQLNRALSQCTNEKELPPIVEIKQEYCFYIQFSKKPTEEEVGWLSSSMERFMGATLGRTNILATFESNG